MVKKLMIAALMLSAACAEKSTTAEVPAAPAPVQQSTSTGELRQLNILISGADYQPASLNVTKGEPVRLNFTRDDKPTCGDTVVFPRLNIKKEIPVNQVTSIDITPTESGQLEFTCGMNMMKGSLIVQ